MALQMKLAVTPILCSIVNEGIAALSCAFRCDCLTGLKARRNRGGSDECGDNNRLGIDSVCSLSATSMHAAEYGSVGMGLPIAMQVRARDVY